MFVAMDTFAYLKTSIDSFFVMNMCGALGNAAFSCWADLFCSPEPDLFRAARDTGGRESVIGQKPTERERSNLMPNAKLGTANCPALSLAARTCVLAQL